MLSWSKYVSKYHQTKGNVYAFLGMLFSIIINLGPVGVGLYLVFKEGQILEGILFPIIFWFTIAFYMALLPIWWIIGIFKVGFVDSTIGCLIFLGIFSLPDIFFSLAVRQTEKARKAESIYQEDNSEIEADLTEPIEQNEEYSDVGEKDEKDKTEYFYKEESTEEDITEIEDAEEQELENELFFWEEEVEEKEKEVSDLSVDIQELKIKLNIFESGYNARVGVLYVKLDKIDLSIKEYELRIRLAKEGKLSADVLRDIEDDVRDTFFEEREKINNLEDETSESSQEYKRHLEEEEEARLDEESEQELKRLYRELAKKYHPDKATDKKQSEEYHKIMAEINEAYKAKDIEKLRSFAERVEREEKIAKETLEGKLDRLKHDDEVLSGIIEKLEAELRSLKLSETYKLMEKVQLAKEKEDDLLAQLATNLKDQIAESQDRLDTLIAEYKELVKDLS